MRMPKTMLPSFLLYCYIGAITPGPANLCSLSTALRFGKGIALRQWRGLFTGFFIVSMVSVGITYFLGTMLNQYVGIFAWVGAGYILWMAWHMLRAFGEPIGEKCGHAVLSDRALGAADKCKDHGILPYCIGILRIALQRLLLGAAGSRPVSSLYRPIANLVWLFAGASLAAVICQSPQGGGYCDGGFFDAVCSQLGMASLRRGRSAYCQKDI